MNMIKVKSKWCRCLHEDGPHCARSKETDKGKKQSHCSRPHHGRMKAKLRVKWCTVYSACGRVCMVHQWSGVNGFNEELSAQKYFCLPFDSMVIVSHAFVLQSKLIFKAMHVIK